MVRAEYKLIRKGQSFEEKVYPNYHNSYCFGFYRIRWLFAA